MLQGNQLNITTDLAEQTQTAHALVLLSVVIVEESWCWGKGKVWSLLFCGFHSWTMGLKLRHVLTFEPFYNQQSTWLGGLRACTLQTGFQQWECDVFSAHWRGTSNNGRQMQKWRWFGSWDAVIFISWSGASWLVHWISPLRTPLFRIREEASGSPLAVGGAF